MKTIIRKEQAIKCCKCDKYLFTECEINGRYHRYEGTYNYIYDELIDDFFCDECFEKNFGDGKTSCSERTINKENTMDDYIYWIDKSNIAHKVKHHDDISDYDYQYNVCAIIDKSVLTGSWGAGDKQFIVSGSGRGAEAIQELVFANSLVECIDCVKEKYKERIENETLINIQYYEVM